jgi:hypothetical protein
MANVTAGEVLARVDELLPNAIGAAEKRRWLCQAEGFVVQEILRAHEGGEDTPVPEALADGDELLVPAPYDELYRHYVESQIHYANGEMARCANASSAWNNAFLTYRDYYARTHVPVRRAGALRLC